MVTYEGINIDGITSTEGINVDHDAKTVTIPAAVLEPTKTVSITNPEGGDEYTLALASNVPKPEAVGNPIEITSTNNAINADGVYKFAANFSGTVTISATNVKLIGADTENPLQDVLIDLSNVSNANLWIKDLNITSSKSNNIILFGSGTANYLTVKGENSLVNTANNNSNAVINVGGGLNILGNGSLTAELKGSSATGAVIGFDNDYDLLSVNINIGGSVTIEAKASGSGSDGAGIGTGVFGNVKAITIGGNANVTGTSNQGAGIGTGTAGGTVSAITIGGTATVTGTSTNGNGIGAGSGASASEIKYGEGTTIKIGNNDAFLGTDNVSDLMPALTTQDEPEVEPVYEWTKLPNGESTCKMLSKTAGYVVENNTIKYKDAEGGDLFTLSGITSTEDISIKNGVVTLAEKNLVDGSTSATSVSISNVGSNNYTLALADDITKYKDAAIRSRSKTARCSSTRTASINSRRTSPACSPSLRKTSSWSARTARSRMS